MLRLEAALFLMVLLTACCCALPIRPPSVPLICHDPYFSIWAPNEVLSAADTQHWTGGKHNLLVHAEIDGVQYRMIGKSGGAEEVLPQTSLDVLPTRTIVGFEGHGIQAKATFLTPTLPDDLDLFARPLTYLIFEFQSTNGKAHDVRFQVEAGAEIAASHGKQLVKADSPLHPGFVMHRVGTSDQPKLVQKGDGVRIDWGHFYVAGKKEFFSRTGWNGRNTINVPAERLSARVLTRVTKAETALQTQWMVLAYDDDVSIQYFGQNLSGWWKRKGMTGEQMVLQGIADFETVRSRCEKFDAELISDLKAVGGEKYALLCSLAYRQSLAASKLVADPKGQPLFWPKENTSNGCIGTSDVIYPMSPITLLFGPALSKALVTPILAYSASSRWKFPFAPHDLGTYPQANGQVYGGGERTEENQMPVEESANMLILMAAIAHMEGNAKFSAGYWPTLTKWAEYLKAKGFDPENQLCTDDFLGHQAHNVNLSCKAILGLRSYAELARRLGHAQIANQYLKTSQEFAARWMKEAADGDHTRLTFDKPGTWSQKYNLVWDKLLGFNLFPDSLRTSEMAYYRKMANPFGPPLDNRSPGAKIDWTLWSATLTQNRADFEAIVDGAFRYVNESPQRVGMGDWYNTSNGHFNFMHSRPVVGGLFLQMLYNEAIWKKYASQDRLKIGNYAPIPAPPKITRVLEAADSKPTIWSYTFTKPSDPQWMAPEFSASDWKKGKSGFGTEETPGTFVNTVWDTSDLWIRGEVALKAEDLRKEPLLWIHHDETVEVYINGVHAFTRAGWTTQYEPFGISPAALKTMKPGRNVIAAHCHQTSGGQYLDIGLVRVEKTK